MDRPPSKYPPQKLVKMTPEDEAKLLELTHAVVELQRQHVPNLLGHQMATTSHVVRLLIRRAHEEYTAIQQGRMPDSGLIQLMLDFGGMRDHPPRDGYLVRPWNS